MSNSSVPSSQSLGKETQPQGLPPSTFWRIAENIPSALQWGLMVISIIIP